MSEPTSPISSIEKRLAKLERLNRLYLIGICILVSVILGFVTIGAADAPLENVKTRAVTIVDENNVERAHLGLGLDGRMGLEFRDPDGVLRELLGVKYDGTPAFYFYDQVSKTRVNLSFAPDGKLSFTLYDKNGKETFTAP